LRTLHAAHVAAAGVANCKGQVSLHALQLT
jgi:hypothetical protein